MKSLKIFNIILFCLICAAQAFALYLGVEMIIGVLSKDGGAMLGVALGLLPVYIITIAGIAVLTIINTITTSAFSKKLAQNNLPKSKLNQAFKLLPWLFILINIAIFAFVLIMANS